jgi:hypothetical protein
VDQLAVEAGVTSEAGMTGAAGAAGDIRLLACKDSPGITTRGY